MNNEIGIIMAAGLGERLRPITLTTPKPLVKVKGSPMIETVIAGLERRGVKHMYVIVGYLKEQFEYLTDKYANLTLIENKEYTFKNNISSIHAVRDVMGTEDCFICEADLYISDNSIFDADLNGSCYYGKMVKGHSDDWVFDTENDRITRVGKCGDDVFNMVGISYFTKNDAKIISDAIDDAYKKNGHEQLYWDEIVNAKLNELNLTVHEITGKEIVEIDTVEELMAMEG